MLNESNIDAISENATATITALKRYQTEGAGESFRQYRETVAAIAGGKPVDAQTLTRVLQFADKSADMLQEDVGRAVLIAQVKAADIEATRIASECKPIADEHRRLEAEFLAVERMWREKSDELNARIDRLRAPLRHHETIRRELRNSEAPRPVSLQTNWGEAVRQLSDERRRIQHAITDPTGSPDCTPGRIKLWRNEEAARIARLAAIDRQVAVFRRAEELVREMYLCEISGLWTPTADANKCLERARQEIADAEVARAAAKRKAAIEAEQAAEAADAESDMEPPGRISEVVASLESSGV